MSRVSSLAEKWEKYRNVTVEEYMDLTLNQEKRQREVSTEDWNKIKEHIPKDSKCLDIGCGGMWFCSHLYDEGWKDITGMSVDIRDLVSVERDGSSLNTIKADACNMPMESETFDFVWSRQTFEHLMSPWLGINEVYRILKPGGKFMLILPTDDDIMIYGASHLYVMGDRQWKNLLEKVGFKSIESWFVKRGGIHSEFIFFLEKSKDA